MDYVSKANYIDYEKLYKNAEAELDVAYTIIGTLIEREGGRVTFKTSKLFDDVRNRAFILRAKEDRAFDCTELTVRRMQ